MNDSMFGNSGGGNVKYISVVDGKFAIQVSEQEATKEDGTLKPYHRKRVNKQDKTVYEFTFTEFEGLIDKITTRDSDYGQQLSVGVRNADTVGVLSMNLFNQDGETLTSTASSIGDQIGLIDFSQPVKISLFKKDNAVRGLSFTQNGVYIPSRDNNEKFREHIAQRPQAVKKKTLNGEKWDFSAPSAWQWEQIQKGISRLIEYGVGNEQSLADVPELQEDDLPY